MSDRPHILVVGGGQAGGQTLRRLLETPTQCQITFVSNERISPYERPPLSKGYLKGETTFDQLRIVSDEELADPRVTLRLGEELIRIAPSVNEAHFASGLSLGYDAVILALGARARPLPVPGAENCIELRDLKDSQKLRERLDGANHITIIGGGVIGLEVAATARLMGKEVTVLEAGQRVMGRILPGPVAGWLRGMHEERGVRILTETTICEIRKNGERFQADIRHSSGETETLNTDIVLSAIGVVPNVECLPEEFRGSTGGIRTDATGKVIGLENVYAIGDMAECFNGLYASHIRLETWRNADNQAASVAATVLGTPTEHTETPWMWSDQYEHNLQVVGLWQDGCDLIQRGALGTTGSTTFWLKHGVVAGAVMLNSGRERRFIEKMVANRTCSDPTQLADTSIALKSMV